ncbi:MAG: RNA 2'-phosphotransferase [Anaerolineales bacterium]|nr:RNA 2'-phosphotransferase [Anaerolineales bacterium]
MTDPKERRRLSKFLSLVLRHKPETVGLVLEPGGWLPIDDLIAGARAQGVPLDRPTLLQIVAEKDKRRFALNGDQTKIRASQGHSVPIDLGLMPQQPPPLLYHGTATRFLDSIKIQGLLPQGRNHVHLSRDQETARAVGQRYGKPVILTIDAATMYDNGHAFLVSANGVWLTLHVPVAFIDFPRTAP